METSGGMTNEVIKNRVRDNYSEVVAGFDPKGPVLNYLFEHKVLTQREFDKLNKKTDDEDRGNDLLQILLKGSNPRAFVVLRETLLKEEPHRVKIIDGEPNIIDVNTGMDTEMVSQTQSNILR